MMYALRCYWLALTFDDFVHSVIVCQNPDDDKTVL